MDTLLQNISAILEHPASLIALIAVLFAILSHLYFRRVRLTTPMIVTIALMLAMTVILHQFRLYHMPQGGSVTLGAMVPLLFVSYRYGVGTGCLAGFLYGIFNMMQDPYLLHPVQVLFDYPLPYMALSLAALFPAHRMASTALAFLARFFCHIVSGVVFFASYAPAGTSPLVYSLTFNATYLVPECLICFALLKVLPIERLMAAMDRQTAPHAH